MGQSDLKNTFPQAVLPALGPSWHWALVPGMGTHFWFFLNWLYWALCFRGSLHLGNDLLIRGPPKVHWESNLCRDRSLQKVEWFKDGENSISSVSALDLFLSTVKSRNAPSPLLPLCLNFHFSLPCSQMGGGNQQIQRLSEFNFYSQHNIRELVLCCLWK